MKIFTLVIFVLVSLKGFTQPSKETLRQQINEIIGLYNADIGVSIRGIEEKDSLQINGNKHYPMISVFKFHIALTVLNKVDKGELSLDQKLFIKKSELLENTWSPFREKHPDGDIAITLSESLQWMISYSDNNICDILIRLIGGIEAIDSLIGGPDFIIKTDEEGMHQNWDAQYLNTTTPVLSTQLLNQLYQEKILTKKTTEFLYKTMLETYVGQNRIKGRLPKKTAVAHRPGSSFTNDEGLTAAINDIGIVRLPNGKHFAIAIFVHDTMEKYATGEVIIAAITEAAWRYFCEKYRINLTHIN